MPVFVYLVILLVMWSVCMVHGLGHASHFRYALQLSGLFLFILAWTFDCAKISLLTVASWITATWTNDFHMKSVWDLFFSLSLSDFRILIYRTICIHIEFDASLLFRSNKFQLWSYEVVLFMRIEFNSIFLLFLTPALKQVDSCGRASAHH